MLHLELLGGLRLTLDGIPVVGFVSSKAQALLCYLAVTDRPHLRSSLAALLWGDMPEADAGANLRQALANLNRLLPGYLDITRQTVGLKQDSARLLDVAEFERYLATHGETVELSRLESAVTLYQGDLLQDFAVRDAPAFEEWLMMQQQRLREKAMQALYTLSQAYTARVDFAAGIAYTRRLLQFDTWREEAHRQLMLLLARSGQRSAALRQYNICQKILQEELGVEPMASTTALYERIRAAGAGPPSHLPFQPTPLFGREDERAELARSLADPAIRLVTITGPGGVGKTRLGIQAAADSGTYFLHGVCFVSLAAVTTPALLLSTIADALKVSFVGRQSPKQQLLNVLHAKELLLMLDNFEHLIDAAGLLSEILAYAPEVKLLVTSRERLQLHEERLLPLGGLQLPPPGTTGQFESYSAVQLFVDRARRVQPRIVLDEADRMAVHAICQLVEGLPLGIELAAASLRVLRCADIFREISHNRDFLATRLRNVPERQRSIRATFAYSWHLLSPTQQSVYRKLSVLRGGFTREAAEQVAGATLPLLHALADKSLLLRDSSGRYHLHELLRQYAQEQLEVMPDECERVHHDHCDYFMAFLAQRWKSLSLKQQQTMEEIAVEIENVRAAWEWGIAHGKTAQIAQGLDGLCLFFEVRSRFQEGADVFERAVSGQANWDSGSSAHDKLQAELLGKMLSRQAFFYFRLGRYHEARELTRRGLNLFRQLACLAEQAKALNQLGNIALSLGEYGEAEQHYEASLALHRQTDNRWGVGVALNNLGEVSYLQGKYPEAATLFEEDLTLCQTIDDRWGVAIALNNLGKIAGTGGQHLRARQLMKESLSCCKALGDQLGVAEALSNLGEVAFALEQIAEAKQCWEESLRIAEATGDQASIAAAQINLGWLALRLGDLREAQRTLRTALTMAREMDALPLVLRALLGMAAVLANDGEDKRAAEVTLLVIHHPVTDSRTRERAERLLREYLPEALSARVAAARLKAISLEEAVNLALSMAEGIVQEQA